jgi:hypothetical protein
MGRKIECVHRCEYEYSDASNDLEHIKRGFLALKEQTHRCEIRGPKSLLNTFA